MAPLIVSPMTLLVRSVTGLQVSPSSVLQVQQRRVTFLPVTSWQDSEVWPRTAMKNRNRVPVNSSYTGHGFMDRWPGRKAVPRTRMSSHWSNKMSKEIRKDKCRRYTHLKYCIISKQMSQNALETRWFKKKIQKKGPFTYFLTFDKIILTQGPLIILELYFLVILKVKTAFYFYISISEISPTTTLQRRWV